MADSNMGTVSEGFTGSEAAAARPAWDRRKKFILAAICVAQFMVVLDIAIVNVALPSIKTDLGFSEANLQWVVTAYAIFFGGFLLLGGRLSDYLGRRRLFMFGLALFSFASLMCGFAWSELSLIVFRSLQGLGGALLSPAALAILVTTYREGRDRNLALGVWGGVAGSGAAAGTLLGGLLTSGLGWQWIFYVNVPIGIALVALTPVLIQRDGKATLKGNFDVSGAVTVTAGLMVLVYALTRATQIGWGSVQTITLLAVSGALLISFGVIELRSRNPILPLRVLRLHTPRWSNIIQFLVGVGIFSQFFLLTLYMQQVLGYSALRTGVAYLSATLLSVIFAVVAQAMVNRVGLRVVTVTGQLLLVGAAILYTQLPVDGNYWRNLLPGFILTGIGLGMSFVPLSIGALTGVRPSESGAASGMINTSGQIGGAVGLAAITTVVTTATANFVTNNGLSQATPQALTHGFQIGFIALAGVTGVSAAAATLLRGVPAPAVEEGLGQAAAQSAPAGTAMSGAPAILRGSCPVHVLGLVAGDGEGVLSTARSLAPQGMQIERFDVGALPRRNGHDGDLPPEVERLRAALARSGALLVVAPDGDGATTKLAMDWATHEHVAPALRDMPVAVVEPGDPGAAAESISYLRETLAASGAHVESGRDETSFEAQPAPAVRGEAGSRYQPVADALAAITRQACPA
jgi:EmrB/QacA subfamily drug resistance transporter